MKLETRVICGLIGDITVPPAAFFALIKYGPKAIKAIPSLGFSFRKLKSHSLPSKFNMKKIKELIRRNGHEDSFFHGSGSSSLLIFTAYKQSGGLMPTGKLLEKNMPPFSGETRMGIINRVDENGKTMASGVNRSSISTVDIDNLEVALNRYLGSQSHILKKPFNLEDAQKILKTMPIEIRGL